MAVAPMTDISEGKRDFFVSFNKADRAWATWIAWVLEEAGYTVFFQDWDFKGNFVLEMDRAHTQSRRTVAVLSPDYLTSRFTAPEWAARFAQDATSEHDLLIPVRVRPCELEGLLAQVVYVDLVGCDETTARDKLVKRVEGIRLKPDEPPLFPGGAGHDAVPERPVFPAGYVQAMTVEQRPQIHDAQFTVYHPKEITPERWDTLLVYAHISEMRWRVYKDAQACFGQPGAYSERSDRAKQDIAKGAEILVVPELPGCQFNPPADRFHWFEDVHRREFRLRPTTEVSGFEIGKAVNGRVAFYIGPILIAEVAIWAFISNQADAYSSNHKRSSPTVAPAVPISLMGASGMASIPSNVWGKYNLTTSAPYNAIFVSYAHDDSFVVERLGAAYKALGMAFLRDQEVLRSGEK